MDSETGPSRIQFVHVDDPGTGANASCTTSARSYVMKRFHRQRQEDARKRQVNFRYVTADQMQSKHRSRRIQTPADQENTLYGPPDLTWEGKLDPFDSLAVDVSELPGLLRNRKSTVTLPALVDTSALKFQDQIGPNTDLYIFTRVS